MYVYMLGHRGITERTNRTKMCEGSTRNNQSFYLSAYHHHLANYLSHKSHLEYSQKYTSYIQSTTSLLSQIPQQTLP